MRLVRAILASVLLVSGAGVLGASTAQAQLYPHPEGVCVLTPVEPNPSISSETEILLVLSDLNGNPIAGVVSTATLLSQPGGGATVTPLNFTTDANGQATLVLATGDAAGVVTIQTVCGELSANLNIPVGQPPGPPNTGTGVDSALTLGTAALAMSGLAAAALALTGLLARQRQPRS
jgi:hypothetical protein